MDRVIEIAQQVHSLTLEGSRRWFARCNVCGRRRLVACYYEVYTDCGRHGSCWRWACGPCLMVIITDIAERLLHSNVGLLKAALAKIKDEEGKVCLEFELCTHASCRSSYSSWAIADAALKGKLLE